MADQEVFLKFKTVFWWDVNVFELAEPGCDAIDDGPVRKHLLDDLSAVGNLRQGGVGQVNLASVRCDGADVFQAEPAAVD